MAFDVLIVDDSALSRRFVRQCLEIAGLRGCGFLEAKNGAEAFEMLKVSKNVRMVFTDLNMPVMDGEGLLKAVRAEPDLKEVRVVVVTSVQNEVRRQALLSAGALAVLGKPLTPAALTTTVAGLSGELTP